MRCPHCRTVISVTANAYREVGNDAAGRWSVTSYVCPACQRVFVYLGLNKGENEYDRVLVLPKASSRPPCPTEVPSEIAQDYTEACTVLPDSPKASAALSRRCLQSILRDAGGVKKADLSDEIQQVLDSKQIPTHLAEAIDAVRNIGNFAAHPIKSKNTGEILPVEPEEAEWTLDVIEALFDFYYVQPSALARKRESLNAKLREAGKPSMK